MTSETALTRSADLAAETASRFRERLATTGPTLDAEQRAAVDTLCSPTEHGFYVWGDVGRGKSMIADHYFRAIPTAAKRRVHFYEFFRDLHTRIVRNRMPLERTLHEMLGHDRAVLFDEFHVHDVADSVYLTRTLEALIELDVLVIATSNYAPAELLPDPLFHDRFLPAISLIESHLTVVPIGAGRDYRETEPHASEDGRDGFASGTWTVSGTTNADSRSAQAAATPSMSFGDLCEEPLGPWEYLSIAARHERLRVSDVPDLATLSRQAAARFGILIDVLVDTDTAVDFSAAAHWNGLRCVAEPPIDIGRTLSRLALLRTG